MFAVLAFSCTDPAFCATGSGETPDVIHTAGYRETAASGDPYKYIRSGNYARILAQAAWQTPTLTKGPAAKKVKAAKRELILKKRGLRG